MMWRATNADGSLMYPTFVETLIAIKPLYWLRLLGGLMYLVGHVMMAVNLAKTMAGAKQVVVEANVIALPRGPEVAWTKIVFARPVVISVVVLALAGVGMVMNAFTSPLFTIAAFVVGVFGALAIQSAKKAGGPAWHRMLEGRALVFTVFSAIAVLAGGVAELVPSLIVRPAEIAGAADIKPYRPLELEGRDVFIKEGCYTCHSQMIRPMRFETTRYGDPSTLAESIYDHPFQWGSKRTGPDLAREGGKYPNLWHYRHMMNPRDITQGSNMPGYPHMATNKVDLARTQDKMGALKAVGVPYKDADLTGAQQSGEQQAAGIVKDLAGEGVQVQPNTEIVAVIAYLQRLGKHGTDEKKSGDVVSSVTPPETREGAAK
jgi:cytochrome c oxidase cbb3-type subunit I/II